MKKFLTLFFVIFFSSQLYSEEENWDALISQDSKEFSASKTENSMMQIIPSVSENPDIALILNFGAGWFSNENSPVLGGHAIDENGFTLQGAELNISHAVDPYFTLNLNFQFVGMHIEEFYGTTTALPWNFQSKIGFFNASFGRENPIHLHSLTYTNYSLMHSRFLSNEHFSGSGVELSYLVPTPFYFMLTTQIFDTRTKAHLRTTTFNFTNEPPESFSDFLYVLRGESFFNFTTNASIQIAASGAFGKSPYLSEGRATLFGADIYWKWRDITGAADSFFVALTIEAILRDTQIPGSYVRDWGGYAQFDLQLSRTSLFSIRGDYIDTIKGDISALSSPEKLVRGSFVFAYAPTHFSRLRFQYDIGKQHEKEIYHAIFMQLELLIGAHQAHSY